jgi:hypothetical protein
VAILPASLRQPLARRLGDIEVAAADFLILSGRGGRSSVPQQETAPTLAVDPRSLLIAPDWCEILRQGGLLWLSG